MTLSGKRIYIISAVFPPEPIMTAATSADIAEEFTKRGYEVTVFTSFPNRPAGKIYQGYRRKWKMIESRNGYTIIRTWHTISQKSTFFSRFLENITFGSTSSLRLFLTPRADLAYMNTWPIFSQLMNSLMLRIKKTPVVASVQDIYPESLIDKGMLNENGWLAGIMRKLDRSFLNHCAKVTTLSPNMRELLIKNRGIPAGKVEFVPNWSDETTYTNGSPIYGVFRQRQKIDKNTFVALFAGSLTLSAGLPLYIETAEKLQDHPEILIILAGDGSLRESLEQEIKDKQLSNIRIIYPLNPSDVPLVQAAANVLLLSLTGAMAKNSAPSKQIVYMFSGRPIAANLMESDYPAQIIREADAGFILPPGDAQALADLLVKLAENPSQLEQMGRNAKSFALKNFGKSKILPKLIKFCERQIDPKYNYSVNSSSM